MIENQILQNIKFTRAPLKNINGIYSFIENDIQKDTQTNAVTKKINAFYEEHPFPNYEEYDSLSSFYDKASGGIYAKMLDEQIPLNVRILEVGCGTGQLSVYLAHSNRTVVGTDLSLSSLKLADDFKIKNNIQNLGLVRADIFDLPFEENSFDFVISKGVLHHTYDCKKAFEKIAKLVRKGGFIIIGLYNRYGRFPNWIRKQLYNVFPKKIDRIDFVLKNFAQTQAKRTSWILDQYCNPHETWHSVDEVLSWFDQTGFTYINSVPNITFSNPFSESDKLFHKHKRGTIAEHFLLQLLWIFTISREGALFDIIGRKN